MKHPIDLLVSFEDGTLTNEERAVLDAHLASCDRCRTDLEMASTARHALRGLPPVHAPEGALDAAAAEAERIARDRSPEVISLARHDARAARWPRIAAGLGAVAAVALVATLALPRLGGDPDDLRATAEGGAGNTPAGELTMATAVEVQDLDYDLAGVQALATAYRSPGTVALDEPASAISAPGTVFSGTDAEAALVTEQAKACLTTAFEGLPGEPVRLIQAHYLSTPATLGVFLEGPGAGQPPTRAVVLVAASEDCSLLASSRVDLDGE